MKNEAKRHARMMQKKYAPAEQHKRLAEFAASILSSSEFMAFDDAILLLVDAPAGSISQEEREFGIRMMYALEKCSRRSVSSPICKSSIRIDRIKLAAEMARAEIKLYELAEKSGVTRATISAIKGGKSCREETAVKLAAALGVPLTYLLK